MDVEGKTGAGLTTWWFRILKKRCAEIMTTIPPPIAIREVSDDDVNDSDYEDGA